MGSMDPVEVGLRLGSAVLLGALLGLDRELRGKPMGLRTLTIISLGSAVFTLTALELEAIISEPSNIGRILQGIIAGIGVVGVGVILHQGRTIRLATTGACIWLVGGVGIACGLGLYFLAAAATGLTIIALILFGLIERGMLASDHRGQSRAPDN
jgi:putative Mg2+ transporter-C (MgtC) family protein